MSLPGAISICGLRTPVKTGTEDDHKDLKQAYGCYDIDTSTVWLDENVRKEEQGFWLTHETLHALMLKSGAIYATAAALGIKRDDPRMDDWEEAFIRVMTPHVLETFGPPKRAK